MGNMYMHGVQTLVLPRALWNAKASPDWTENFHSFTFKGMQDVGSSGL